MTKTTEQLIAQAEQQLKSRDGYHYDPQVLAETIEAGLPEGAEFLRTAKGHLVWYSDRIENVIDGKVAETMEATDARREAALIEYAKRMARRAVGKLA